MQRTIIPIFLLGLLACSPVRPVVEVPPPPPPAVDHAAHLSKQGADAVLWQNASAEGYRLFLQGYELARLRLAENLKRTDKRPPAVIVDIDETVLDNSPYQVNLVRDGQTYDQASWKEWTDRSAAKASPGALEFLNHAKSLGCAVFYITNRDIRERASTMKNLASLGFPFVDDEHLLLMDGQSDKTERRALVAKNHHVVLLIGDQLRDFDERFKDRSVDNGRNVVDAMADTLMRYFVLLPNPTYGTYRDAIQGKGSEAEKVERMKEWFRRNGY